MLCLVAIFKNESEILEEWIEHYIKEGCKHFFLIDNDSNDNYIEIINKYKDIITLVKDKSKYKQVYLYNKYFKEKIKKYEWTIVCDLDEFIYARRGFKTILDYLKSLPKSISHISIPWKIFGSNGYDNLDKKEPESVIKSFTKRINYDKKSGFQGVDKIIGKIKMNLCKSIIRSKKLVNFDIHFHIYSDGLNILPYLWKGKKYVKIRKEQSFVPTTEKILENSFLHLNHYAIRSLDWFTRVKMTRGSAASHNSTKSKSRIEYFYEFDKVSNDLEDKELFKKMR